MNALDLINYWIAMLLLVTGLYIVIARGNLVKKLVGLSIFQTSVYLIYISPSKILGGTAPIIALFLLSQRQHPQLSYRCHLRHEQIMQLKKLQMRSRL